MTYEQIQLLLAYLGYYDSRRVDGLWGPASITATERFQMDYGLMVDGIAGASTQKALRGAVADTMPPINVQDDFWAEIKHFSREEFRCKCGGAYCGGFPHEPEGQLVRLADTVREHFGEPVIVTSGLRCETHNRNVGGVWNSRHLTGRALDFRVRGKDSNAVLPYVQSLPGVHYAYAIDENHVHMDV